MELYIPHDFMLWCLTEHGDNFTCIFLTLPFLGNKFVKWFIMDVIAQEAQNISAKILHVLSHICIWATGSCTIIFLKIPSTQFDLGRRSP